MEWPYVVVVVVGGFVVLIPAALIWYICIGGICAAITDKKREKVLEKTPANLTCTIDADCPPGYVCLNGRCMPAT